MMPIEVNQHVEAMMDKDQEEEVDVVDMMKTKIMVLLNEEVNHTKEADIEEEVMMMVKPIK
jgi:hypothetical protein